jgi:putative DNA primase/helicase
MSSWPTDEAEAAAYRGVLGYEPRRDDPPDSILPAPGLVIECAAYIKPERVDFLWPGRLPLGKCTLVAGEGGLGKSMLLASVSAIVSRAGLWPCGEGTSPLGSVII